MPKAMDFEATSYRNGTPYLQVSKLAKEVQLLMPLLSIKKASWNTDLERYHLSE